LANSSQLPAFFYLWGAERQKGEKRGHQRRPEDYSRKSFITPLKSTKGEKEGKKGKRRTSFPRFATPLVGRTLRKSGGKKERGGKRKRGKKGTDAASSFPGQSDDHDIPEEKKGRGKSA